MTDETEIATDHNMSDTPIGAIVRTAGSSGPWWKSKFVTTNVEEYTLTVKWAWWLESWYIWSQRLTIVGLFGYAAYLWSNF